MSLLERLRSNTSGSIVPTTAVLLVPLTIGVGALVDYTNYTNMRGKIQSTIDAAGIAAAREVASYTPPDGMTDPLAIRKHKTEYLKAYALKFVQANIGTKYSGADYTFDLSLQPNLDNPLQDRIKVTSEITYDTIFGGRNGEDGGILLKVDKINEQLNTIVQMGNRTVEIALVLDNSGSMAFKSGNTSSSQSIPASPGYRRIDLLEQEALKLVDNIYNATAGSQLPKPVQFSLVPFSSSVNNDNLFGSCGYHTRQSIRL